MERLKKFLRAEVAHSYKNIVIAYAKLNSVELCLSDLSILGYDSTIDNNLYSIQVMLENLMENIEDYLRLNYKS